MDYKAVVFDYGGVIANKPNINFDKDVSKILQVNINRYRNAYFLFNSDFNSNKITRNQLWKKILAKLNRLGKLDILIKYINSLPSYVINQDVLRFIAEIKKCGYKTGILTNRSLESAIKMREALKNIKFDTILVSSEIGYSKSDIESYQLLAQQLKTNLRDIIMVDDTERNIKIIQKVGIHPLLFTNYERLKNQLLKLLPNLTSFVDIS